MAKNVIVTASGKPVLLRGVNVVGYDSGAPPDPALLATYLDWGANIVRLAISRDRVLEASASVDADHLEQLDSTIEMAARAGAYTMLSLRRLDDVTPFGTLADGTPNHVAPQPDADSIGMWRVLGERYESEPAVLFDLYASPHAPLDDDLTGFDTNWELWRTWVQMMVAELRLAHPRALCIAGGLDWGTDLSGFPVPGLDGAPLVNLVYGASVAPGRSPASSAATRLAQRLPIVVTEWTPSLAGQSVGSEHDAARLAAAGIGWIAAGGPFALDVKGLLTPTAEGIAVQRALARDGTATPGIVVSDSVQRWFTDWRN